MNMVELTNRIQMALEAGKIDQATAQRANSAIREAKRYGSTMTPKARDSILTNRFGI